MSMHCPKCSAVVGHCDSTITGPLCPSCSGEQAAEIESSDNDAELARLRTDLQAATTRAEEAESHVLNRYSQAFPNQEYIGFAAAVDLLYAEVLTCRKERDEAKRNELALSNSYQDCRANLEDAIKTLNTFRRLYTTYRKLAGGALVLLEEYTVYSTGALDYYSCCGGLATKEHAEECEVSRWLQQYQLHEAGRKEEGTTE